MESIKFGNLLINFTTEFNWIWDNKGSPNASPVGFWRPVPSADFLTDYFPLGDYAVAGHHNINKKIVMAVVCEATPQTEDDRINGKALMPPDEFERVWDDKGSKAYSDGSIWRPIPPSGYVAMGLVASRGYDKPSRNSVRCVRADLVIASYINELIWNNKRSPAKLDFSAWSISPPGAAAGEVYLSPGTFVGAASYTKPSMHIAAYSLRMQIPLHTAYPPPAPALSGDRQPAPFEKAVVSNISKLAWFTVKDPNLSALEQLRTSPTYRLERLDKYVLVGFGHNKSSLNQSFKWTATRGQNGSSLKTLTHTTGIEIGTEWGFNVWGASGKVSAKLSGGFTHTQTSSEGWTTSTAFEINATVPAHKAVAVYLVQSDYKLLRENGTQVATDISYTDGDNVYWSEYPPARECEVTCKPLPAPGS
ncbi:Vps62-related protein [Pseudomonas extremaustralis]|uniref:Vps62-related protein n=1 Tax=Pseudomonas extremaustralis TaxID=359110 RepID=UPI002805BFFC|nr:Vps62-related protein [Pseudomonas extremaustralis]